MCPVPLGRLSGEPRAGGRRDCQAEARVVSGEDRGVVPPPLPEPSGQGETEANSNRPGGQALCREQLTSRGPREHEAPCLLTSVGCNGLPEGAPAL